MNRKACCLVLLFVIIAALLSACGGGSSPSVDTDQPVVNEPAVIQATEPVTVAEPTTTSDQSAALEPIPAPLEANDGPFLMLIDGVFAVPGRGTIATGRVARGAIQAGNEIEIIGSQDEIRKTVITGIEMFGKVQDSANTGDNTGILLRGIDVKELAAGMVLIQPGTITSYADALRDLEASGFSPAPQETGDEPFLMPIDGVFAIPGRGTIATGRVVRGTIKVGDEVEIIGPQKEIRKSVITGIEMFRKAQDSATAEDNTGILLRGINVEDFEAGMILIQPGSITSYAEALRELE